MPTRKIRDLDPQEVCTDPHHNPPQHRVYSPGIYEHICPRCGKKTVFTVRRPYWQKRSVFGHGERKRNLSAKV